MRIALLTLLLSVCANAGQSITLSSQTVTNASVPACAPGGPCTVEMMIQSWDTNISGALLNSANAAGVYGALSGSGSSLQILSYWLLGTGCYGGANKSGFSSITFGGVTPANGAYLRWTVDGAHNQMWLEGWDASTGARLQALGPRDQVVVCTGHSGLNPDGVTIGPTGAVSIGFFRIKNVLTPQGSAPPQTGDHTNCVMEWRFDGNANDSCSTYNGTTASSTYVSQASQSVVKANVSTAVATGYGTPYAIWDRSTPVALKASTTNTLDGTQSWTANDSATLTYLWGTVSGPGSPTLNNSAISQPVLSNCTFGDYSIPLTVTDAGTNSNMQTGHVGCVPYNSRGVVQHADPNVAKLLGPMIAYGQNPQGYMDERAMFAVGGQTAYYTSLGINPPTWATAATGTISYPFLGISSTPAQVGTTLHTSITSSSTAIVVDDASKLPGLASLPGTPTEITMGDINSLREIIRICSTTGVTGQQTLTTCYDGRGVSGYYENGSGAHYALASSWSANAVVGESRMAGTSTLFVTDGARPMCPAGAPGPMGLVGYATGTVTLTAGSAVVTLSGGTWTYNSSTGVGNAVPGTYVRVAATHASGTTFVFWGTIVTFTDGTHVTLDRPAPTGVDGTAFTYKIVGQRFPSLEFLAPDATTQRTLFYPTGCESETSAFFTPVHSITAINDVTQSAKNFSYTDVLGMNSAFGPNFYGSGLAGRNLYYRSGFQSALDQANAMDEYWVRGPELAAGWNGLGFVLNIGGGVISAIADKVLNASTVLQWSDVREFAVLGNALLQPPTNCVNGFDTRDSGYVGAWNTLLMLFDTTMTATWLDNVKNTILVRDQNCKGSDNSWANGNYWGAFANQNLTLTNGSAVATGSSIPSTICRGIGSGTATVVNGSTAFVVTGGTLDATSNALWITGTTGSGASQINPNIQYTRIDATHGTLSAAWAGDSGAVTWMDEAVNLGSGFNLLTIAASGDPDVDPQIRKNWGCIWNNSGQITLNRAWDTAATPGTFYAYNYLLAGFGQQPYMLGIKGNYFKWAQYSDDSAVVSGFSTLRPLSSTWVRNVGYNPSLKALNYARVFGQAEPVLTPAVGSLTNWTNINTSNGLLGDAVRQARVLNAEGSSALWGYYDAQNGSGDAVPWGDEYYSGPWGFCPWAKSGVPCGELFVWDELGNASLSSYKYPGFFLGMGMGHQWPALSAGAVPGNPLTRSGRPSANFGRH